MKLKVIGSGSSGNMYILTASSGQTLVVDIGFQFPVLKKALNFKISNTFLVFTHLHGDHAKGVEGAMKAGIPVYSYWKTFDKMGLSDNYRARVIKPLTPITIGEFTIMAFDVKHDVPTFGLIIYHEECGTICYITDTTYIETKFEDINHFLIEANYCKSILVDRVFDSKLNSFLGQRVIDNHLSIQDCQRMLALQDLSKVENIVLLHLSDRNSDADQFQKKVKAQTGKPTYIAEPGLELNLTLF